VDGITHKTPSPFHVLATQNPIEYEGTFPLPETQLDRFLMRISLGYPSISNEITIMEMQQYRHPVEQLSAVIDIPAFLMLQETVKKIYVDSTVKQYIATLVAATRNHPVIRLGASPRGSLALFRSAQARALLQERDFVLPDDIKALAEHVLAHRLILQSSADSQDRSGRAFIAGILEKIPVPGTIPGRDAKAQDAGY
ncbi:MAG: MoxR family ATPase, partial [Chloroflexota bacterium]